MKCAIVAVGTELLFGHTVNTDAVYLSQQLNLMGIDVLYHYTVGDNPKRLADILKMAMKDCDLVITTGGTGPTQDDLTKEVICQVMDDVLVEDPHSLDRIIKHFERRQRPMSENNLKQAMMPSRAVVFDNNNGTAPGFALECEGKIVICLPGPPNELNPMFEESAKPWLMERSSEALYYRTIRTFGIGESMLETKLLPLIDGQTDPTLATYAKMGEATVRIASKRPTLEEARSAVEDMIAKVYDYVGEYIYSTEDESLPQVVGQKLISKNLTMSTAESCTGGMIAAAMTDISGISAVFERGIVTYSNGAKMDELGVLEETLAQYGAVSPQTAEEMVRGLKAKTGSRVCVSVTGIAGPGGGTPEKPVGLIYVGVMLDDRMEVFELRTNNTKRQWNRNYTMLFALYQVNRFIDEMTE
ncbi:MAG: competence/damage-inducible protein A [Firmicutes bacterium]|nr:competence/damage-inducible protein A [Bacillota bacterium]MBQ5797501.1 competence/damage-inducible protein A [Bacillota bacterium]